jgi:hypothetical protein
MRTNKAQGVLYLLETLLDKGCLKKKEAMEALDITELTFRRYMSEIRCYFVNYERNEEVYYDKAHDLYVYNRR